MDSAKVIEVTGNSTSNPCTANLLEQDKQVLVFEMFKATNTDKVLLQRKCLYKDLHHRQQLLHRRMCLVRKLDGERHWPNYDLIMIKCYTLESKTTSLIFYLSCDTSNLITNGSLLTCAWNCSRITWPGNSGSGTVANLVMMSYKVFEFHNYIQKEMSIFYTQIHRQ